MTVRSGAVPRDALVVGVAAIVVLCTISVARVDREQTSAPAASEPAPPRASAPLPPGAVEPDPVAPDTGEGCSFPDRGFGSYGEWKRLEPGRLLVRSEAVADGGAYDLWLHFHGADAVRKLLAPDDLDLVIAALDAGDGSSAYERAFAGADDLAGWLEHIDRRVAEEIGRPARAGRVFVSSWSAGYAAVEAMLEARGALFDGDEQPVLSGIVLLDSLHAPFGPDGTAIADGAIEHFIQAAEDAKGGGIPLFVTHSAVATDGYASTTQTASLLIEAVGGRPERVAFGGDDVLQLERTFEAGNLSIDGYGGADEQAHCAQLRLLPELVLELLRG